MKLKNPLRITNTCNLICLGIDHWIFKYSTLNNIAILSNLKLLKLKYSCSSKVTDCTFHYGIRLNNSKKNSHFSERSLKCR